MQNLIKLLKDLNAIVAGGNKPRMPLMTEV